MHQSRRDLLAAGGATLLAGLAGCGSPGSSSSGDPTENGTQTPSGGDTGIETPQSADGEEAVAVDTAVAAEWNAMRARVLDALSLGIAGEDGAGVAQDTFARFEQATGEYGAHEMLESTGEDNYAGFEEALGELRTAGLEAGDVGRALVQAGTPTGRRPSPAPPGTVDSEV
jgi:hypothetical protein